MLRVSRCVRMKPYLHAFAPGARASERGMLYRNNNMNAYARVGSLHTAQRTRLETYTYMALLAPDQLAMVLITLVTGAIFFVVVFWQSPFMRNNTRHHQVGHGLNEHERFVRNSDMERVLAAHAEAIASTRSQLTRPAVLDAPGNYVSRSGRYAPRSNTTDEDE